MGILPKRMWTCLILLLVLTVQGSLGGPEESGSGGKSGNNNVDDHFNVIEQQLSLLRAQPKCQCQQTPWLNSAYRPRQHPNTRMMIRLRRYQMMQDKRKQDQMKKDRVKQDQMMQDKMKKDKMKEDEKRQDEMTRLSLK